MALISLPVGNVLVPWIGPATTLVGQPWFTSANLSAVYRVSVNRAGYISNIPGSSFPAFSQVIPTAAGQVPDAYIFAVTTAFSLDSALIGQPIVVNELEFVLAVNQTAVTNTYIIPAARAGSYLIGSTAGLSSPSYTINGAALTTLSTTVPVALTANDSFGFTATTAGVVGSLILIKQ